jgi:DNA-binding NtrC family response regulator
MQQWQLREWPGNVRELKLCASADLVDDAGRYGGCAI